MLIMAAFRYLNGQLWMNLSRCYYLTSKDDNILLHVIVGTMVHELVPGFTVTACKFWNRMGTVILLLLHVGPVECVYYWAHRALHHHYLFSRYHSHHHSSFVTEPVTGTAHPFAEHLLYLVSCVHTFSGDLALGKSIHEHVLRTYHSLHHSRVHTNFALFMPIYDYLGGTVDTSSDKLHASIHEGQ
ncbi:unnamed protein product [Sphagnum jensenii]